MLLSCWAPSPQGQSLARSLVYPSKVPVYLMNNDQIRWCHLTSLSEEAELMLEERKKLVSHHWLSGKAGHPLRDLVMKGSKTSCLDEVSAEML